MSLSLKGNGSTLGLSHSYGTDILAHRGLK